MVQPSPPSTVENPRDPTLWCPRNHESTVCGSWTLRIQDQTFPPIYSPTTFTLSASNLVIKCHSQPPFQVATEKFTFHHSGRVTCTFRQHPKAPMWRLKAQLPHAPGTSRADRSPKKKAVMAKQVWGFSTLQSPTEPTCEHPVGVAPPPTRGTWNRPGSPPPTTQGTLNRLGVPRHAEDMELSRVTPHHHAGDMEPSRVHPLPPPPPPAT